MTMIINTPKLSDRVFNEIARYVQSRTGIKMPESKKTMMHARLFKRLQHLNLNSYEAYRDYVFKQDDVQEIVHMIDAITTNLTRFFREHKHYDYLKETAFPKMQSMRIGLNRPVQLWSAGCSTGEEPYSLAMLCEDYANKNRPFQYDIQANDISTRALDKACQAVYEKSHLKAVPETLIQSSFNYKPDAGADAYAVRQKIKNRIHFLHLNLMDDQFPFNNKFDVIFCRNVLIYFEIQTQEILLKKFYDYLHPHGYLFLSHVECITTHQVPFRSVAPSIYVKTGPDGYPTP